MRRLQWKAQQVKLSCADGPEFVMANICGPFAVHQYYDANADADWRVMHIPSGMSFPPPMQFERKAAARRFVAALLSMQDERFWSAPHVKFGVVDGDSEWAKQMVATAYEAHSAVLKP